jgi:hypothetical protein
MSSRASHKRTQDLRQDSARANQAFLEEIRQRSVKAKWAFMEIDLSFVSTLIELARGYYQRGNRRNGDRSKANALVAIQAVRRLMGTTDLSPVQTALFTEWCNELERSVAALTFSRRRKTRQRAPR